MKINNLKELLCNIAKNDLTDGSNIWDHPCMVAVRVMGSYENDIDFLIDIIKGKASDKSKRAQTILALGRSNIF